MFLSLDGKGALSQQVYRALRGAILSGQLPPGARLPSTRALAADLAISRNVVLFAYEQLRGEGYVVGKVGSGTVVSPTLPETALSGAVRRPSRRATETASPRLSRSGMRAVEISRRVIPRWELRGPRLTYDFRFGRPAFDDFPRALWCRLLGRRARASTRRDLDYGPPEGRSELRAVIADRLRRLRGVDVSEDCIVIVAGSQQALDLIARLLLDPGDRVLIEEPHYLGARWVFEAAGAELVAAEVDAEGMRVPKMQDELAGVRLAYVTPSHQFPTGVVMPLARRLELLDWATRNRTWIIEDDYDSEYRYGGRPLQALAGLDTEGRVIYVGTFSKLMFPSLRIGYLVVPKSLREAVIAAKGIADTGCAALPQLALADFIRDGHFERHLNRTRARNAKRRAVLLESVEQNFGARAEVSGTATGLHVLVWLCDGRGRPIRSITRRAEAAGVGVYPVAPYYLRAPARSGVLLGYAALSERQIRAGIFRLAEALRKEN